jgi:hypothetical protein
MHVKVEMIRFFLPVWASEGISKDEDYPVGRKSVGVAGEEKQLPMSSTSHETLFDRFF